MNEQLSALIDNEIALADAAHLLAAAQSNKHLADAWGHYHLIGDAMRGTPAFSADFQQNLMQKIELEATVLSPNAQSNRTEAPAAVRTKLPPSWSIAASMAAVMIVGWVAVQQQPMIDAGMKVAALQPIATQPVTEQTTVASLKESIPTEYLMAHQASAPSLSSYYIQTVNYAE
ncbi:MAG: sigma-E factor negative regulatory protein [Methylotenera sp.]|nr:sigma-E factor negative regulatory protein [Methylotenera sp.]